MSASVHYLTGVDTPEDEAERTKKTVELVSQIMDRARRGEIRSMQIVANTKAGNTITATAVVDHEDLERLIGAMTVQVHELASVIRE